MNAVAAVAAVQARIGAIESRLGVARPVAAGSTPTALPAGATATAATATPATSFQSVAAQVDGGAAVAVTGAVATSTGAPAGIAGAGIVGTATPYAAEFNAAGARWGISPRVLAAVAHVESRFQADVVSSAGAVGMMQLMPSTAASLGVDPLDPVASIDAAARLLRSQVDRFGSIELALAAYNVGPGTVANAGGIQPGSQAERYVSAVLEATGRIA